MIEIKLETYGCECGYTMNADAYSKPGPFARRGVSQGTCPSCKQHQLSKIVDLSQMTTTKTVEQAGLDAETKEAKDNHGQTIKEQVGERYRLNPQTGQIEKRPIEVPKQEPLTQAEKDEKLAKAQANLDRLSKLEHKAS